MRPHRRARQPAARAEAAAGFTGGNQFIKQRDVNYTSNARVNIFIFHRFFWADRQELHLSHLGLRKLELPVLMASTKNVHQNNQKDVRRR